ncbi:putative MFS drug efflux transporter [Xylaria venustula]|nr:putative MFS drug efflux transporter [Xylaria venustula]
MTGIQDGQNPRQGISPGDPTPTPSETSQPKRGTEKHGDNISEPTARQIKRWKWALAITAILSSIILATATNMIWGRIYTQFNPKWLYIFNVVLFEAGSALCGGVPNINAFIVSRVLRGIGGAELYIGVMTLISITTTMAERPLYASSTGITWGLGIVLGPIRWAFYINLFIGAAAAPAYLFLLPSKDPRPGVPWKTRLAEMDYIGAVFLIGCLVTLIVAINLGRVVYAYKSGQIIALFVDFGVLLLLLTFHQIFSILTATERRLIQVQLFRSRTMLLLFVFTRNDAALEAGVRLLPLNVVLVVFIFVSGGLIARLGYYMPWYTIGGLLALAGGTRMYTVNKSTSESRIYGHTVLIGAGVGLWLQASFSVAPAIVEPKNIPLAIGFLTLSQLAIANSIFLSGSQTGLLEIFPSLSVSEIRQAI